MTIYEYDPLNELRCVAHRLLGELIQANEELDNEFSGDIAKAERCRKDADKRITAYIEFLYEQAKKEQDKPAEV